MHRSGHRVTMSLFSIRSTASSYRSIREHRMTLDPSVVTARMVVPLDQRWSLQFRPRSSKKKKSQFRCFWDRRPLDPGGSL